MGTFDKAFAAMEAPSETQLSRRRKSLKSQIIFWLVNIVLIAPAILVIYLTIVADGLRHLMAVFAMKLSRLPIPGAGMMANFDGFNRIDIATVTALILCVTVSYIWFRVFTELSGHGRLVRQSNGNPILIWLLVGIAVIMVIGDALIFYAGMTGQSSGGWSGTPQSVCIGATVLYSVGLAFLGGYHADYHTTVDQ